MPELVWPHHELSVEAIIGPLHLNARLRLHTPWTVIFGPSGSGKSSILRAACGLIPEVKVDFRRTTVNGASVQLHSLSTYRRSLAYAPQHAALFPHLSAEGNIRFPAQVSSSLPRDTTLADEVIEFFDLRGLANSMPEQLSGGERRRVALARAFAVPNARLMLLDEPFTGLDRAMRDNLLPRMRAWLAIHAIPVLSVTHDVDEALLLDADVIRLENGRVLAQGPAREVLAGERDRLLEALR